MFYEKGLFPYLDYELSGQTHPSGIIYIDLQAHSERASGLAKEVEDLKIIVSNEYLATAASQLIAERQHAYETSGVEAVRKALVELDNTPWQNLDRISSIDTLGVKRKSKPFYINAEVNLPAKKLEVSVTVEEGFGVEYRQLLPLFRLMCFLVLDTVEVKLSDKFGFYPMKNDFKNTKNRVGQTSYFNIPNGDETGIDEVLESAIDIVRYIKSHDGFIRLVDDASKINYWNYSSAAPNALFSLTDTGIVQGAKGWGEIATKENAELILRNIVISVKKGRSVTNKKAF